MSDFVLTIPVLEETRREIESHLIDAGAHTVFIVDQAGNIITSCGKTHNGILDFTSLAALTAANFAATSQIARLIGEDDFSLLFHKGKKDSIHFARLGDDFILVTIFGDDVSLGIIRLKVSELMLRLSSILGISV